MLNLDSCALYTDPGGRLVMPRLSVCNCIAPCLNQCISLCLVLLRLQLSSSVQQAAFPNVLPHTSLRDAAQPHTCAPLPEVELEQDRYNPANNRSLHFGQPRIQFHLDKPNPDTISHYEGNAAVVLSFVF